jgi:outer membrane protein TolC
MSNVDTIIPDQKLELERLLAASMDQNSSILLANNGADIKFLDLELAKAERYPKIDFVAGYNRALNESSLFPDKYNLSNDLICLFA